MIHCHYGFILVIIVLSIDRSYLLEFSFPDSEYQYLPPSQGVLNVKLSCHVIIERKSFPDVWIYKNGFVTIGAALEQEAYPLLTGSGKIQFQPFENLAGESIVAVFVTMNTQSSTGTVRFKEILVSSINGSDKETFSKMENMIMVAYGNSVTKPLRSVFVVEWIRMKALGVKGKENSFRLFIISSSAQSFAIYDYWNISTLSYKLFSETYLYQSGVRSYTDTYAILPFYQITDPNIPSSRSSNVFINNTWLMSLGDSSYTFDLGLPTHGSPNKITNHTTVSTNSHTSNKLNRHRFITNYAGVIPNNPISIKNRTLSFKSSLEAKKIVVITEVFNMSTSTSTDYPTNQTHPTQNIEGQNRFRETNIETEITVSSSNISRPKEPQHYTRSYMLPLSTKSSIEDTPQSSTKLSLRNVSQKSFYLSTDDIKHISPTNTKSDRTATSHNQRTFPTIIDTYVRKDTTRFTTTAFTKSDTKIADTTPKVNDKKSLTQTSARARDYIQHRNLPLHNGVIRMLPSNDTFCKLSSCGINEECFVTSGIVCCICKSGTAHLGSQCARLEDRTKMRAYGSVSFTVDGKNIILDLALSTLVNNNHPSIHITLQSSRHIEPCIRNFFILLYPLFHIPMAFYASAWSTQHVPNLSSLIDNVAALNIYISVEGYGELYVTFKLDRSTEDQWTISLKDSLDLKMIRALNLDGLKLDERSTKPQHINYRLSNKNSVDFVDNSVSFLDESKNRTINIKWKGLMTFAANCLSNIVDTRKFFIKFSDTGYCSSDCIGAGEDSCRMMCLTTPYVFGYIPDPCEGNHCPNNMVCVVDINRYDCKCHYPLKEYNDRCISDINAAEDQKAISKVEASQDCSKCSKISSCRILNAQACCICNTGYIGNGISCFLRDSVFEIKATGQIKLSKKKRALMLSIDFRLLFRQWRSTDGLRYATYVDTGRFPYLTTRQKDLTNFLLLLSPIFDIPMSLFARDRSSNVMTSIFAASKGSLYLTVNIEGISPSGISVTFNVSESNDSLVINIHITRVSSVINPVILKDAHHYFEKRQVPNIKYRISGRQVTLLPYSIPLYNSSQVISVSGTGELDDCAASNDIDAVFEVSTQQPVECKTRCEDKYCEPFCQAVPVLTLVNIASECVPSCHKKAQCIENVCVCSSGYSGDGLFCHAIRKTLECESEMDCNRRPFFECKNATCVCKQGYELKDRNCVAIDPCKMCATNEHCAEGECLCRPQFVRNRISQRCTFDCSLCDIYSTTCTSEKCVCKDRFVYEVATNVTCAHSCQSESDCPTNEVCDASNKCSCPTRRIAGLCQLGPECHYCHVNALCRSGNCQCLPDWIGDGTSCHFNCSLCFHPLYCNPTTGCSCPPDFIGDGKQCTDNRCPKCPPHSRCEPSNIGYRCQCLSGMTMYDNQCVKYSVAITILPPGSIVASFASEVEIFCLIDSKINNIKLSWSRKSGNKIIGHQYFLDGMNQTLRLFIPAIRPEDADEYVCSASTGESSSVMVSVENKKCRLECHRFATCIHGKCQCDHNFVGDGIQCAPMTNCSEPCPEDKICDENLGLCRCRRGLREYQSRCLTDCSVKDICDHNARCNDATGQCICTEGFTGNGKKCWIKRISCILTKKCSRNSSCHFVDDLQQHICVCDPAFIGNGDTCVPRVNCDANPCGSNSFCEPTIVQDHLGNLHKNGRCSCEPGYVVSDNKCKYLRRRNKVLWISMGEAIISLREDENKSKIHFIDISGDNIQNGGIVALTGDCAKGRLYWSGQNGVLIRSANVDNMSVATTLLSGAGKITGMTVDTVTGNLFFTDIYKGTITILDTLRNVSQTIVRQDNYQPGQIVAHSASGRIYWTVGDFLDPRIETALMDGKERKVFVSLNNRPISLTLASNRDGNDTLCWVEVNDRSALSNNSTKTQSYGFLKCVTINDDNFQKDVTLVHVIKSEEPSAAFAHSDKFYWGVRKGKYIRTFETTSTKLPIIPNCCDVGIRGLVVMYERCEDADVNQRNPCLSAGKYSCPNICVPKITSNRKVDYECLNDLNI